MSQFLQKDSAIETSLPITQSSFTGLNRQRVLSSNEKTGNQDPSKLSAEVASNQQTLVQENPQCRICLQSQSQSGQPFITPCNCIGSVQFIHLTCYTQWIRTSLTIKQNKQLQQIEQSGLKCQICKMPLEISMSIERTFIGWNKLKSKIQKTPLYFTILAFMLISIIVLLCFSAANLPSSPFTFPSQLESQIAEIKQKAIQKITMFCCLIISILLLFFMVFLLLRDFLIAYRMKVWSTGKNYIKIELKGILKY